jgi:hypothetical protein
MNKSDRLIIDLLQNCDHQTTAKYIIHRARVKACNTQNWLDQQNHHANMSENHYPTPLDRAQGIKQNE